ncbi:ribokinase [Brachybacterium sp. J144]|uniref:ribokinase n=1 Tax=Brachybacterium sp. J144 TaxID=3116487 RepID=UPI002E78C1D8|nr:ribokinase [Brachybacterium sp. J144]MEE1651442.1 ribokinase [Brachybacterium sp. J144]
MSTASPVGVVVVGSASVDLTAVSTRRPAPGETLLGESFSLVLGGKGANQAIAASRAGAPTRFVGCVGEDDFATVVRDGLAEAGVDLAHLCTVPGRTGIAHIRVDADGENDIVVVPLANSCLTAEHVDAALAEGAARVLLTQLEIPTEVALHALAAAHRRGVLTILDPAPAQPLPAELWPLLDVVTPNETEAEQITGAADPEAAAHWFLARGTRAALITCGAAGSLLVTAAGTTEIPAREVEVVDTTAAGDALAGYLAARLAAGDELAAAAHIAAIAGSLAVTRRGASPSIPAADEVLA